jgi:transposase-like protein
MSQGRHTESQRIRAVKRVLAGRSVGDVAREYQVKEGTIRSWKAIYRPLIDGGSEDVVQLRREKAELEMLVDDLLRDRDILLTAISKHSIVI